MLVELRDAMEAVLAGRASCDWAHQEFAAIVAAPPAPPRVDPWRRTSGMHRIADRRALAVIRELWIARDAMARTPGRRPHRMLPDSAIVAAATATPTDRSAALTALPVFSGRDAAPERGLWLAAISRALALPVDDLPRVRLPGDGPPAPAKWATRTRRRPPGCRPPGSAWPNCPSGSDCRWRTCCPPTRSAGCCGAAGDPATAPIAAALAERGARPWQIELTAPVLPRRLDARRRRTKLPGQ